MPQIKLPSLAVEIDTRTGDLLYTQAAMDSFTHHVLGVTQKSPIVVGRDSLAVIFDLKDWTKFCDRNNAYMDVPRFLDIFLKWLFDAVKERCQNDYLGKMERNYHFPYFAKFTGDGVLFLWDANGLGYAGIALLMMNMVHIAQEYLEAIAIRLTAMQHHPSTLRCGMARGQVFELGGGNDYAGSCINLASRLQSLPGLTFAAHAQGCIHPMNDEAPREGWDDKFTLRFHKVRGLNDAMQVILLKYDLDNLSKENRSLYYEF